MRKREEVYESVFIVGRAGARRVSDGAGVPARPDRKGAGGAFAEAGAVRRAVGLSRGRDRGRAHARAGCDAWRRHAAAGAGEFSGRRAGRRSLQALGRAEIRVAPSGVRLPVRRGGLLRVFGARVCGAGEYSLRRGIRLCRRGIESAVVCAGALLFCRLYGHLPRAGEDGRAGDAAVLYRAPR